MLINRGVYSITNKTNGKRYVGNSKNIRHRWGEHKKMLRENNHDSSHLQNAWNKYGEENFVFEVIEECDEKMLLIREQVYLDVVRVKSKNGTLEGIDHNLSYNTLHIAGSPLGTKLSEETKKKISEANKGSKNSFWGKHHSKETRTKMVENHADNSGPKHPMFGKHHLEETKQKISNSKKGTQAGENNPRAKLTWKTAREIREKYISGNYSSLKLAKEYGVAKPQILNVIHNRTWKELSEENK